MVTANKQNLKNVYDPTCGSGSLLLRVKREAGHVDKIYGQELNRTTYNLARMNMILHDVHYSDFDIKQEDTLERPQHRELRFDAIVANPPFSANWSASQLHMNDDRFSVYGKLAPSTKADMAFVQHMIYHLSEEGTMAKEFSGDWEKDNLLYLSDGGFTNGVFNDPKKVGRGYKLVNVLDMYIEGTIDENKLSLVDIDITEFNKNKVDNGDVFFTRSSLVKEGIAYSNTYLGNSKDITFDGHLIRMRPKSDSVIITINHCDF